MKWASDFDILIDYDKYQTVFTKGQFVDTASKGDVNMSFILCLTYG